MKISWLALCMLCSAVVVLWGLTAALPPLDLSVGASPGGWFPLVHLFHNGYLQWRIDHLSRIIAKILPSFSAATFHLLSLTVLLIGTERLVSRILLSARTGRSGSTHSFLLALCATIGVLLAVGRDSVTLASLAWVPLLALLLSGAVSMLRSGVRAAGAPFWVLLLFVALELCASAHQEALLSTGLAVLIAHSVFGATHEEHPVSPSDAPRDRLPPWIASVLVFAPAVLTVALCPAPPIPDYPTLAHVVPDDGLPGIVRPLIGPDLPIAVVDRAAVHTLYRRPAALALIFGILVISLTATRSGDRPRPRGVAQRCGVIGAGLCGVVVLDTLLPEQLAQISPILSLARLLPWGTATSFTPLFLGAGVLLESVALAAVAQRRWTFPLLLAVLAALWAAQPMLRLPTSPYAQLAYAPKSAPTLRAALTSPSHAALLSWHQSFPDLPMQVSAQFIAQLHADLSAPRTTVALTGATITTEPPARADPLTSLTDGDPKTRWSNHRGGQHGDERMTVRFPHAIQIRGLELDPGDFRTDFPRGLTIRAGSCIADEGGAVTSQKYSLPVLFSAPSWQGPLHFTPNGYAYFGGQEQVKIIFPQLHTVECLVIEQTAQATFDWSVAELRILQ